MAGSPLCSRENCGSPQEPEGALRSALSVHLPWSTIHHCSRLRTNSVAKPFKINSIPKANGCRLHRDFDHGFVLWGWRKRSWPEMLDMSYIGHSRPQGPRRSTRSSPSLHHFFLSSTNSGSL